MDNSVDFEKGGGLVPVVVQDRDTLKVLMLAYMNREAYELSLKNKRATFYSRSRNELWEKGETSGNWLEVRDMLLDCDGDTVLMTVKPHGPVCHLGTDTCFRDENDRGLTFLNELDKLIAERKNSMPENSYTTSLFSAGLNKVVQKVGEEAVELVIEAMDNNDELFLNEGADLLYHLIVLLRQKGYSLSDVVKVLEKRHSNR